MIQPDPARLRPADVLLAAAAGGLVAGLPSTLHALATGRRPLEATLAAGTLVLPAGSRPAALLAAAVPVHAALSVGWMLERRWNAARQKALTLGPRPLTEGAVQGP
jgi:hypothetical protein